eukprot:NODE_996_length_2759_cov_1.027820.p1 type:complete len:377 gc:universal NODE_996_length_2759_cov_1.027820:1510-2640(+)
MSNSILTEKSKSDLLMSIIAFLDENLLAASSKMLQEESQLKPSPQHSGLLERKWVTVSRLQKRCMDLEKQISELQAEIDKNVFRKKQHHDFTPLPMDNSRFTLEGHKAGVTCVAVHPKYTTIASASEDATIKIYDYEVGTFEFSCKGHTKAVTSVAFSKDGKWLASASQDTLIKLWDVDNNYNCIKTYYGHDHYVSSIIFSQDLKYLYSCSRDNTAKQWNVLMGTCENTYFGHNDWVRCLDINEENSILATAGSDSLIKLWSLETHQEIAELNGHEHVIETIKFAPKICVKDAQELTKSKQNMILLFSAGRDKEIKMWNTMTQECLYSFKGHENWIRSICIQYSLNSGEFEFPTCILSVGDDKSIRVSIIYLDMGS